MKKHERKIAPLFKVGNIVEFNGDVAGEYYRDAKAEIMRVHYRKNYGMYAYDVKVFETPARAQIYAYWHENWIKGAENRKGLI